MMQSRLAMLDVNGLSHAYGRHQALDEVSIRLRAGEAVAILGANGAGKTTLLTSIPRLLLLDEPSLGLSPRLSAELFAVLARIATEGKVSILMVEQNARRALAMASRAYLLALGRIVGEGDAKALARDSAVARSYLGL